MLFVFIALLAATVHALDNIAVPSSVAAEQTFQVTFEDGNSDTYRVYLAATLTGVNGPTCYLDNSTSLSTPFDISIPADVGPSADYYSIAIADLSNNGAAIYSNRFNLTGATGVYSSYESQLGGAPFWDANDLPCTAYSCARACATASYPQDLSETAAYDTMKSCILKCPDVSPAPSQTAPAHLASTSLSSAAAANTEAGLITLTGASGAIITAVQTIAVVDGSTITEAVLDGSLTLTLGSAAAILSGITASLATNGVAVDGTTTVPFTTAMTTSATAGTAGTATAPSASASSSKAAAADTGRPHVGFAGWVGLAGVAALFI